MKNLKKFENFEYPDDIPSDLNKEQLYASGSNSTPGERLRNFMSPITMYFELLEMEEKTDKDISEYIEKTKKTCIQNMPYIKYWLKKAE
jgi:hypothetical protein